MRFDDAKLRSCANSQGYVLRLLVRPLRQKGVADVKKRLLLLGGSGLVGQAMDAALREDHEIVPTAGHHEPENGYRLGAEEPERLLEILDREDPEAVISTIRGDHQAQLAFHETLADWLARRDRTLLYVSTANVFDGDLSRPWTEADPPAPKSVYGVFKRDCEQMLGKKLGDRLVIFRLGTVWAPGCPRIRALEAHGRNGEAHPTWQGDAVNVTLAEQIGAYAKYVLAHDLRGIFHVGTTDMTDYFAFEQLVCETLHIAPPEFAVEKVEPQAYQAILPKRAEIPDALQMTVAQVLDALKPG